MKLQPYRIVMLAPEAVLAAGKSFQEYGLSAKAHGRDESLFGAETFWGIPDWLNVEPLPSPVRQLTRAYIRTLLDRRAGRRRRATSNSPEPETFSDPRAGKEQGR